MENIKVTKRDGAKELIDLEKIHQVLDWASEGLENVSVSQVEMKSSIQFYDGITTDDIHETLVKTAADLISENTPDYQYMASRLALFRLRKVVYGGIEPTKLYEHIVKLTKSEHYDKHILEDYSKEEIDELDSYIDHERDMNFAYAGFKQLEGKYLVQNRATKEVYETPQMLYMLVSMCLFSKYNEDRLSYVKRYYDAASTFKISLPTPIMAGVRTPTRQFSSCVVIESDDSLDSINTTSSSIVKYVSKRAGIGINVGRIRALGSEIRSGEAVHTGLIPFLKLFQASVKSCSQGGVRGGAATAHFPIWHLEVESLLVLKNNRGVEDNRVRHMDYSVQINKLMYNRLIKGQDITLFSPSDVDGLYDAFFEDQDEFERLYLKYEDDTSIRKKVVKASELFSALMQERASTGRIYIQNVDHCNTHSSFIESVAPIRMSNLCQEIAIPTKPLNDINDEDGEIGLCTLAAINLGEIKDLDSDMENLCDLLVRSLDELLDYQDYPIKAAKISTMKRRMLGVGVINYAYYLAKNGLKYSDGSANKLTHRTFESLQYHLLKASNKLAMEKGHCDYFNETKYSKGLLPIDTYKESVDDLNTGELELDWESLRASIKEFGLRNSTLTAQMPSETSSQVSNSTNGIEPPRGLMSVKSSKDGILKQVVPEINNPNVVYEPLWTIPNNKGYLQLVAIMQKFIDQSLSANTNYDPTKFEGGRVPMKVLLQDLLTAYKVGVKTLYYHNTRDGADDSQGELVEGCDSGGCVI
ncbi:Ribonucleotide reductase of class Ia [Psychrobacter phage D'Alembert]|nr:Ribonucleotide reductase of class Ia [Psychrobacter phage D'Alembert]